MDQKPLKGNAVQEEEFISICPLIIHRNFLYVLSLMHLLHVYIDKYKCILFKTEAPLTLTTMFNSSQMILISQKLRPYQRLFYRPNIKSTECIICFKIDRAIRNRWQNDPAAHRMMMRFGLRTILRDPFGWRKDIWNLGEEADDIRLRNYCSK